MKRSQYNKVKKDSLVVITIGTWNKGRKCRVIYAEKEHVVLRSIDGERFYGGKSLDCPLMVLNKHDIDLIEDKA